jgi:hypothetical protein
MRRRKRRALLREAGVGLEVQTATDDEMIGSVRR